MPAPRLLKAVFPLLLPLLPTAVHAQAPEARVSFPGGASALSETHGDWTLVCGVQDGERLCVITQSLASEGSGQRVLAVEIEPEADGGASGSLMLPFGLSLAEGVRARVGTETLGEPAAFDACYDYGCVAEIAFDADGLQALRRAATLSLVAVVADSGESVTLSVSLTGISSALDRAGALTGQ